MAIGSAPGQPRSMSWQVFYLPIGPARQPRFAHGLVKNDNQFAYMLDLTGDNGDSPGASGLLLAHLRCRSQPRHRLPRGDIGTTT